MYTETPLFLLNTCVCVGGALKRNKGVWLVVSHLHQPQTRRSARFLPRDRQGPPDGGERRKKDWGGGKEGWRERRKPRQQVNQPTYREGGEEQNKNFRKEERTDEGEKEKEMTEDHWSRREGIWEGKRKSLKWFKEDRRWETHYWHQL